MRDILTPARLGIVLFTLAYVLGFGVFFLTQGNYEFIWYIIVLVGFASLIALTFQKTQFPFWILGALSLWGLLHMAGGGIKVGGDVLYAYQLFDLYVGSTSDFQMLKFDQVVHAYGFAITAATLHFLIHRSAPSLNAFGRVTLAALAAMGLGSLNEIVEFMAVLGLSETGVGGYYNTSLDLVFNALGAGIAVLAMEALLRLKKRDS